MKWRYGTDRWNPKRYRRPLLGVDSCSVTLCYVPEDGPQRRWELHDIFSNEEAPGSDVLVYQHWWIVGV